jgi:hypothetical protein
MRSGGLVTGILIALGLAVAVGCSGAKGSRGGMLDDEWARNVKTHEIDGNLDRAEAQWRREIERDRATDMDDLNLLTDNPPKAPESYGKVTSQAGVEAADGGEAEDDAAAAGDPEGFMSKAGKATVAGLSVALTLGMMAAPYLLMI